MDKIKRENIKNLIKKYDNQGKDWGSPVLFLAAEGEGYLKELKFGMRQYQEFLEKFLKYQALLAQKRSLKLQQVAHV